jgi:hypothetical protein
MTGRRLGVVLAISVVGACACGGQASTSSSSSSSNGAGPNLDSSKRLAQLSPTDWQVLCDWVAQEEGGYGNTIVCDGGMNGGSLSAPTDEPSCVTQYSGGPNCPGTVQQIVSCIQSLMQTWCDTSTLPAVCRMLKNPC